MLKRFFAVVTLMSLAGVGSNSATAAPGPPERTSRLALGAGVGLRTNPYRGADSVVVQPIPVITYRGERLEIAGLRVRLRVAGRENLRLFATAVYRFGAYDEDDSDFLEGMDDREDTVFFGVEAQARLPHGIDAQIGYEHDLFGHGGGGRARTGVSKTFRTGRLRCTPRLGLNWRTTSLADYEFGVPSAKATPTRPAYDPGDALSAEAGVNLGIKVTPDWQFTLNLGIELPGKDITDSPIVEDNAVLSLFAAGSYVF